MSEEILIHNNQSVLEDYLKEDCNICLTCQWLNHKNSTCGCDGNEQYGKSIRGLELEDCSDLFNDDLFLKRVDNDTESLFEELQ